MRGAWRAADVRAAEDLLMPTLPDGTLMARAAAGLARRCAVTLADRRGGVYGARVLVLAGPGNNGGDALYAGAQLARRGAAVTAVALDLTRVHPGGRAALEAAGGRVVPGDRGPGTSAGLDLVLDGIVGIGGRGGLRPAAADLVDRVTRPVGGMRPVVVAVDLPSGIDVDTGAVVADAVRADITVTFGVLKPGLLVDEGAVRSGQVDVVDIGLEPWLRVPAAVSVADLQDVAGWWPRPGASDHKYTRGVVGVATGSRVYPGAAVLSVGGALAGPTGAVHYAGRASAAVAAAHPSTIVADRVGEARRVQAWVCGCGLGTDRTASDEVRAVLAAPVPVCLDADAITLLTDGSLAGALRERTAPVVLTPHDREFTRLAGQAPDGDRVEAALGLAAKVGAVVLLKGYRTVVATPDGRAYVSPTGTPSLATAGSGDVLAGLVGSLLASGMAPERAAVAGAFAHGLAGRRAERRGSVDAERIVEHLGPAIAESVVPRGTGGILD